MNDVPIIVLPETLRLKLGEEAAKDLVNLINESAKVTRDNVLETAGNKFERRLSDVKADLIKWMFVFWIGQVAVMVGMLSYFLR